MAGIDPAVVESIESNLLAERIAELRARGLMRPAAANAEGIDPTDVEILRRDVASRPLRANAGEVLLAQAVARNQAAPADHYGLSGAAPAMQHGRGFRF